MFIVLSTNFHVYDYNLDECKFNKNVPSKSLLTLVTSACFSVSETSEGGEIRPPPPFEDTEWSDQKNL